LHTLLPPAKSIRFSRDGVSRQNIRSWIAGIALETLCIWGFIGKSK
jgi:hypothetical protein